MHLVAVFGDFLQKVILAIVTVGTPVLIAQWFNRKDSKK
jgi:hypothetical protein